MEYGHPGTPATGTRIRSTTSESRAASRPRDSNRCRHAGLIAGVDYGGERLAGIWGLYGTYDYLAPDDFRFSSTAFTVGTTMQAAISESLLVQSSGLVGVGYAAAHALDQTDWHKYHYGVAPQALANMRVIAGRRAALDVTAREYFVGTLGGFSTGQRDLFFVGDASLAIRVYRRHALAFTYQLARRSSVPLGLPDQTANRSRVGVTYTFLGSGGFGGVR